MSAIPIIKVMAGAFFALALIVAIGAVVTVIRDPELVLLIAPAFAALTCAMNGYFLFTKFEYAQPTRQGLLLGAVLGANGFMFWLAMAIWTALSFEEGERAYWATLFANSYTLLIGFPVLFACGITCYLLVWIVDRGTGFGARQSWFRSPRDIRR